MKVNELKVPGKLFILGEYSILTPGHSALVAAVDRYITFSAEMVPEQEAIIDSKEYMNRPIAWTRLASGEIMLKANYRFKYITSAMRITEKYIKEIKEVHGLPYYALHLTSELKDASQRKYGLGSSGAVTIGIIQTLLELFYVDYTPELLFKLGVIAHLAIHERGSFGDLAASAYGGLIRYTNFDSSTIAEQLPQAKITDLIAADWNYLSVDTLKVPNHWQLLVGWTGQPASTTELIKNVDKKINASTRSEAFMVNSQELVEIATQALEQEDFPTFSRAIIWGRRLMLNFEEIKEKVIETKELSRLIETCRALHLPAKVSGAGGGDCGIAWTMNHQHIRNLYKHWQPEGILPLPVRITQPRVKE